MRRGPAGRVVLETFEQSEARRLAQMEAIGRRLRALQARVQAVTARAAKLPRKP